MTRVPSHPAAADFAALQDAIAGDVLLPGAPGYDEARTPPIARFQGIRPQAVVRCRAAGDVAETLALVRRCGAETAIRSGGHCFAGRSSTRGILIDVSPMRSVALADGAATVGAGARIGDVYDALDGHGLTIAAGCGPTVGIAGLTLGGGLGILGRTHGLTCDQLRAAEVVLADGRVVDCDEERESDLFWALRGAGGCGPGAVTALTLRTVRAPAATALDLTWPHTHVAALVAAWQEWSPAAPDELAASLLVVDGGDLGRAPRVHVFGAMLGTERDTTELLEALIAMVGVDPVATRLEHTSYREVKRYLADHGPGDDAAELRHSSSKSEFFRRSLPDDVVAALARHVVGDRAEGQARTLDLSPWGGAYNRVPAGASAFPHRAERFLVKHEVAVDADATPEARRAARDWLARSWALVHPWGSGGVYPNFPDPELDDPAAAYYGANRDRVERVKRTYDPDNLFARGQEATWETS
jgi:FAD/FMN-containing dehydrogenase